MAATEILKSGDVPSPCINFCRLDVKGEFCLGCYRRVEEIAAPTVLIRGARAHQRDLRELFRKQKAAEAIAEIEKSFPTAHIVLVVGCGDVGLRVLHSLIHLTYNHVIQRLLVFAASNFVLVALWVLAGFKIFGQ